MSSVNKAILVGDRTNNDEDNLALMTRAAHTRWHRYLEQLKKGAPTWAALLTA